MRPSRFLNLFFSTEVPWDKIFPWSRLRRKVTVEKIKIARAEAKRPLLFLFLERKRSVEGGVKGKFSLGEPECLFLPFFALKSILELFTAIPASASALVLRAEMESPSLFPA